jgi:hypothetical protein
MHDKVMLDKECVESTLQKDFRGEEKKQRRGQYGIERLDITTQLFLFFRFTKINSDYMYSSVKV